MCFNPRYIKRLGFSVPCGKCFECLQKQAKEWQFRLVQESKRYEHNSMITLTYNEENLPTDASVSRRDLQLFMKRLRKQIKTKIKFFACGEYGSKGFRPHYHAIIFGYDFDDKQKFCFDKKGTQLYRSKLLEKVWTLGFSSVGEFTPESALYCAKYMQKMVDAKGKRKPFFQMSKGIGLDAINKDMLLNDKVYLDGKTLPVPRYYLKKFEEKQPDSTKFIKERRKKFVLSRYSSELEANNYFTITLKKKEKIAKMLKKR